MSYPQVTYTRDIRPSHRRPCHPCPTEQARPCASQALAVQASTFASVVRMSKPKSIRKLNREARKFGFDTWAHYMAHIQHTPGLMNNLMAIAAKAHANTQEQLAKKGRA